MIRTLAALVLLCGSACAQTVPHIPATSVVPAPLVNGQPSGPPRYVIGRQDLEPVLGGKADSARLDAEIGRALATEALKANTADVTAAVAAQKAYTDSFIATLSRTVNWTVCATGCNYSSPLDAWEAAKRLSFYGPDTSITIAVADGTYPLANQFFSDQAGTGYVRFIGNVSAPGNVVFSFTNIAGNNGNGFLLRDGGRLGRPGLPGIDGITLRGVGALSGRSTWADQSYGAGIQVLGAGANAYIGSHVVVDSFYYGLLADQGGRIVADGATLTKAGDVNALARFGGVIECQTCSFVTASHVFTNSYGQAQTLGYSVMAEAGGAVYADGSTATDAELACYVARSNGAMWAHAVTATSCKGKGASAEEGGMIELNHSTFNNNQTGIYAISGGVVGVDAVTISGSTFDGLFLDGGRAQGTTISSSGNGGYGVRVQKQGRAELYDTLARLTNNTAGPYFVEQEYGCGLNYEPCSPGSTLIIDGTAEPGWRVLTPAVSSNVAGLVATASMHARAAHGNTLTYTMVITVSTAAGSDAVVVTMPTSTVALPCIAVGKETGATGKALQGIWSGSRMFINNYDNSYPVASGTTSLTMTGFCEVQPF